MQSTSFSGSVPSGSVATGSIGLTLDAAIQSALKQNLGALLGDQNTRFITGARLRALSLLLPEVTGSISSTVQQNNLAAVGIKSPVIPAVVGPFGFYDARASLSQSLFDWTAVNRLRAANQDISAARFSYQDARNLVVFVAANAYLQVIAASARVEVGEAQVTTAQTLYNRANDQHTAGVSPAIDMLRSQVELQSRQQQLIAARNGFARSKLELARIIGLPLGQQFDTIDKIPYAALDTVSLDQALERAYSVRPDFKNADAQVRAAQFNRKAATAELFPALGVSANYGDLGITPAHSHGTFAVTGAVRFPIFDSGRIRADRLQADSLLQQRRAQLEDLRGRIDFEIRTAFLDLAAAAEQVKVGTSTVELARQALEQSQDRFSAGVADNLEVVQAQEAFANANDTYISSLYGFNLAKLTLARAMGVVEQEGKRFLEGK